MTNWNEGDRCLVVEHDNATRRPKQNGREMPATVEQSGPVYVRVRTDNGLVRTFYRESGWLSGDGEHRWRLTLPEAKGEGGNG